MKSINTEKPISPSHFGLQFWTSTECGAFMAGMLRAFHEVGIDAVQMFYVSAADYGAARSVLERLWLRFRMYLSYPLMLSWNCLVCRKPRVMVVTSNTFFAPFLATFIAGKNQKIIHLVYDLYPDVLIEAGKMKMDSIPARFLDHIMKITFRRSAANVFLGRHLLSYAHRRFGNVPNAVVIEVGAAGDRFKSLPPSPRSLKEPLCLLYCGNMGYMHDSSSLIALFNDSGWQTKGHMRFEFYAHGAGLNQLRQDVPSFLTHKQIKVFFGSMSGEDDWVQVMKRADVALVTMVDGAQNVLMPSKTYSALVAGQAILAICPEKSDLAELVKKHDCGWVVHPGDFRALERTLDEMCMRPGLVLLRRQNAFRAGHEFYCSKALSQKWTNLFENLKN